LITWAQAYEDVLLHRALHKVHHADGFYIDVGGYHPQWDSVTKHFYDHGWRGINIEPGASLFPNFVEERPRDINLQVAVTDHSGEVTFYDVDGQLGTLENRFAERHAEEGVGTRSYTVPARTLTEICDEYAPEQIHFLKIDVEGHEGNVIRGMDFKRYRPWILVIEATEPRRLDLPTYHEWDHLVIEAGYVFAYTDVLNRYYVAQEHSELLASFALPADEIRNGRDVHHLGHLERELDQLRGSRSSSVSWKSCARNPALTRVPRSGTDATAACPASCCR
jgi:FkbM family methyltransferase